MKRGGIIILAGALGLVALLLAGSAGAFPPERPSAQGGAPPLISYQGQLTDPSTGDPVADGDYSMTFKIYDAESEGTEVWSETRTVAVSGGLFNVLLGSVNPLSASHFSGPDRWLEVKVGSDEPMTPRQRIASVPYALQAQEAVNADTVDGQDASAFATAGHDHDTTYVNEDQADSITSVMIVNGAVTANDLQDSATLTEIADDDGSGSGLDADLLDGQDASAFAQATHSHSSLDAADGSPTNAIYVDNEGGVGIGTTDSGTNRLKVAGDTEITGELNIAEGAIQDGRIVGADIKDNAVGFSKLNLVLVASSDGVCVWAGEYADFLIEATYDLGGTDFPIYLVSLNRWRGEEYLGQEFSYALIHKVEEDYWNTKWYLRIKNEGLNGGCIKYRVWRLQ